MRDNITDSIKLIPVDRPTEPGFYIKYKDIVNGHATNIAQINNGLTSIIQLGYAGPYPTGEENINREFEMYDWIHIKFENQESGLPTESGIYWVWRDECIDDKMIVYYNSKVGYYQTIGDSFSSSALPLQDCKWQKVDEPEV